MGPPSRTYDIIRKLDDLMKRKLVGAEKMRVVLVLREPEGTQIPKDQPDRTQVGRIRIITGS